AALSHALRTTGAEGRKDSRLLPLDAKFTRGRGTRYIDNPKPPPAEVLHRGTDLAVPVGNLVFATGAGIVVLAKDAPGYGNGVIIEHGRLRGQGSVDVARSPMSEHGIELHVEVVDADSYRVRSGARLFTLYAHFSAFDVEIGDRVVAGDLIGRSGNTGYSEGPHVHYEVYTRTSDMAGKYVDKSNDVCWEPEALPDLLADLAPPSSK